MPVHDWKRVKAGTFHDFHLEWIASIKHALNGGILPDGYYSMAEQYVAGFESDVLALAAPSGSDPNGPKVRSSGESGVLAKPRKKPVAETEMEFYRRKQKVVTVRHVSDDEVVALVEIISPGNKSGRGALGAFLDKAAYLLNKRIHMLAVDVLPPGRRDPDGIHGAIWEFVSDVGYRLPKRKPLTAVSYECDLGVRAYVEHFAVGDMLADLRLFLEPGGCVEVPLEQTYQRAFAEVPKRWRDVLTGKKTA